MTERLPHVHLVDDDGAVRRSVSFMLRTSGHHVTTYASGLDLLAGIVPASVACVLLDVRMPVMDGIDVQVQLRARGIFLPVVMMTGHGDVKLAVRAMKEGAVDFLEKPFGRTVLLEAVGNALSLAARADRRSHIRDVARARLACLTPRERDVVTGLARGHPNKTIAFDLGISPRTVEIHRANLMTKLGAASLSEALRIAFAAGLGEPVKEAPSPAGTLRESP